MIQIQTRLVRTFRCAALTTPSLLALLQGAFFGGMSPAAGADDTSQAYNLRINGVNVVTTRPSVRVGGEWFVPISPLSRALGAVLTVDPVAQTVRVLRSGGGSAIYDGTTGRVLQGFVLAGQVANFRQVQLNVGLENILFPLSGAVALFGVTAREDLDEQVIDIKLPVNAGFAGSSDGPSFQFAALEQRYGLTTNGSVWQQYLDLRGQALAGGDQLDGNLELSRIEGGSLFGFRSGSLRVALSRMRALTMGDQSTQTSVEPLVNSVRGIGYEWAWKGFQLNVYGGRAASSTSVGLGTSGLARYDGNIVGIGAHRKLKYADFSLAGAAFDGPRRGGSAIGGALAGTYARNDFRMQGLIGHYAGFSLRPGVFSLVGSAGTDTAAPQQEGQHVKGFGYGFSLIDSYTPFRNNILLFTALWEDYSRNVLILREESRFTAVRRKSFSTSLRPSRYFGFIGSIRQSMSTSGNLDSQSGFTYGANAATPGRVPVQMGYFRSVQKNQSGLYASGTRYDVTQYSVHVPSWNRLGLSAFYSEVQLGSLHSKSITETLTADMKRFGRLAVHDQLQPKSSHNFGFDWSREFGHTGTYASGGLERQLSPQRSPILAPIVAIRVPVFRAQTLTASFLSVGGNPMFRIEISGPILRRREQVTANSQTALIVPASLTGQAYFDTDLDGSFKAGVDKPIPQIQVWLDGDTVTTTDSGGFFHFDALTPGSHRIRARISTLPANLIFTEEEINVAVMPYRSNRQDFRAIRTGKLRGLVTVATLDDAGQMVVRAFPDARILANGNRDTFTEGDGGFVMGDLPPGKYQIRIDPTNIPSNLICGPASQIVEVKSGQITDAVEFRLTRPVIVRPAPPVGRIATRKPVWPSDTGKDLPERERWLAHEVDL